MNHVDSTIDSKYWDDEQKRWQMHEAFNTTHHEHISHYGDRTSCDLMIVKCSDGRWYIEE